MNIIAIILGVLKAIPILDNWFQQLATAYTTSRVATMRAENIAAIKTAIESQNQIPLEQVIGNPNAGKASGQAGSVISDSPPPGLSQ